MYNLGPTPPTNNSDLGNQCAKHIFEKLYTKHIVKINNIFLIFSSPKKIDKVIYTLSIFISIIFYLK